MTSLITSRVCEERPNIRLNSPVEKTEAECDDEGKGGVKSQMISGSAPPTSIAASGVSAGMAAAGLELGQQTELQLSDLLTVPGAVLTLSGWNTCVSFLYMFLVGHLCSTSPDCHLISSH